MLAFKSPAFDSHRRSATQLALAISTAAIFAACGGGGGGGGSGGAPTHSITGNGFAPDTGPGDVDDYFPKTVGNEWSSAYTVTHAGLFATDNIVTTTVAPPQTILGVQATVLSQVDPVSGTMGVGTYQSYFGTSLGGVTMLGTSDTTDTLTAGIVPYPQMLFPVGLGTVSTITAISLPVGQDGSGNALTLDMFQQIENSSFASVDVVAGSFPNTLAQVTTISGQIRDEALGLSSSFIGSETHWIAPGVGIVKQSSTLTVDGSINTSAQELRGYRVDGVRHGVGNPMTVLGGLSPGDGIIPTLTGSPVVASDGAHFLVVARKDVDTGNMTTNWVARLVDANGAALSVPVDLGPPTMSNGNQNGSNAAVVFDGLEYVVVYEQAVANGFGPQSTSLVAVRVSTQGALIGTPATVAAPTAAAPAVIMPTLSFDGANCLLGMVRRLSGGASRITGAFISPSTGDVLGSEFDISPAPVYASTPALAFDGVEHVIVWDQPVWNTQVPQGVFAARIDTAGVVLDPASIAVKTETGCCFDTDHRPAIASDGSGCMVVWQDFRQHLSSGNNVYANRISPSGQLLDGSATTGGIALTISVNRAELSPTIVYFGGEYLAAWLASPSVGIYDGLYGARISAQGSVLTPLQNGIHLTTHEVQPHPDLAAGNGSCMLTWFHDGSIAPNSVGAVSIYPFGR